jgi:hypothetical protein
LDFVHLCDAINFYNSLLLETEPYETARLKFYHKLIVSLIQSYLKTLVSFNVDTDYEHIKNTLFGGDGLVTGKTLLTVIQKVEKFCLICIHNYQYDRVDGFLRYDLIFCLYLICCSLLKHNVEKTFLW